MAVRPQIRPNTYSKNQASTEAEQRARNIAIKMSQKDDKPRRPVVTEDTTANTTTGSSTSTTTSGDLGLTTNNIPAWVSPDYSYDPSNPRPPNMREMAEAIGGKPLEEMTPEEYSSVTRQASVFFMVL